MLETRNSQVTITNDHNEAESKLHSSLIYNEFANNSKNIDYSDQINTITKQQKPLRSRNVGTEEELVITFAFRYYFFNYFHLSKFIIFIFRIKIIIFIIIIDITIPFIQRAIGICAQKKQN